MSNHAPLRLPETMTRADIGPYLRGVRDHFKLSQQDVSERLHIRHRYIEAIENGAYEEMPGRAYAKGYVHTYAEFLGLDASQVVEICFGPELVREQQKHYVPAPQKRVNTGKNFGTPWRSLAVLGVVAAIAALGVAQFNGGDRDDNARSTVSEVPEEMLAETRTMLMPVPRNDDCIEETGPLGCLFDSAEWRRLQALQPSTAAYFADNDYIGLTADDAPSNAAPVAEAPVEEE